jgi:AbrB family looped-hinge helix DNA binding protein
MASQSAGDSPNNRRKATDDHLFRTVLSVILSALVLDVVDLTDSLVPIERLVFGIPNCLSYFRLTFFTRCGSMASGQKLTVRLSTKGQVILPKAIRQRRRWDVGTRLLVEDTDEGVLLKAAPVFERTKSREVFGVLKASGPAKTLEEMDAGILAEARRRHARD